ncbi:MAG: hypothetical protein ACTSPY_06635 [Candidatus Helarchaeota archaeon]
MDILLYGFMYGMFFLICGLILYKKLSLYYRLRIVIIGYLFQGTYDWQWTLIRWIDPLAIKPYIYEPFYVDLIIFNSTLLSVFIVEFINLILGLILIFYKKRQENWILMIVCIDFILMQGGTLVLSAFNILFPYFIWFAIVIGGTIGLYYLKERHLDKK